MMVGLSSSDEAQCEMTRSKDEDPSSPANLDGRIKGLA